MALPTTGQEIYDVLLADPVIAAALGTYSIPAAAGPPTVRPAIGVFFANEKLPEGTVADGIEISITRMPGYAPQLLIGDETMLNPTWRVYVVGWQSAATLQAVAERVIALLPGATDEPIPGDAPGDGIGVMDQVAITWTNPCVMVTA